MSQYVVDPQLGDISFQMIKSVLHFVSPRANDKNKPKCNSSGHVMDLERIDLVHDFGLLTNEATHQTDYLPNI